MRSSPLVKLFSIYFCDCNIAWTALPFWGTRGKIEAAIMKLMNATSTQFLVQLTMYFEIKFSRSLCPIYSTEISRYTKSFNWTHAKPSRCLNVITFFGKEYKLHDGTRYPARSRKSAPIPHCSFLRKITQERSRLRLFGEYSVANWVNAWK